MKEKFPREVAAHPEPFTGERLTASIHGHARARPGRDRQSGLGRAEIVGQRSQQRSGEAVKVFALATIAGVGLGGLYGLIAMGYTLIQKSASAPTVEQLKRAFTGVPGFTVFDAGNYCKETFGIIARNFTEPQVKVVQARLQAEGVETEEQRVLLRLAGCSEMQGFLFARPAPREEIERMVAEDSIHD